MRLSKIHIINFGQLSNLTFDLPSDKITVFFGQNEAGKSTTVAFIKQVLFGFYLRSNSSPFFEDYKPLAQVSPMGGSLFFEDQGQVFELERLWAKGDKTKRGILTVKLNGAVTSENVFFDRIGNIDGNFYADSFIFNQEMLGQIASLSQKDLLERIYHLGASDSGQLLNLRDKFNKDASALFKKTGKKPEVNRLLTELSQKRDELSENEHEFGEYQNLQNRQQKEQEKLTKLDHELSALQKNQQSLLRLGEQLKNYQQLKNLQTQVETVNFNSENYQKAQAAAAKIDNLKQELSSLKNRLANYDQDNFDLAEGKRLVQKKAELLQWEAEIKQLAKNIKQLNLELEQIKLNSDSAAIYNLSELQFNQLIQAYRDLPKNNEANGVKTNRSSNLWLIIGLMAIIFGAIGLFANLIFGVLALIIGLGITIIGALDKKRQQQETDLLIKQQQEQAKQVASFEQKYSLKVPLDLLDLKRQYQSFQFKKQQINDYQAELAEIKEKIATLKDKVQIFLNQAVNDLLAALNQVDNRCEEFQRNQQEKLQLQETIKAQEQHLNELELKLKAILAADHLDKIEDYQTLYQKNLQQTELKTKISSLQNSLADLLPKLSQSNYQQLQEKQAELNNSIKQVEEKRNLVQSQLAQIQVELNNLSDSAAIFTKKQELANKETELLKASKDYLADLLAAKLIERSLDIASNERFPKMLKQAKEYLKLLTGGRYVDLDLANKITVTRFDDKKREVKYLSRATSEQLYFALKLAFASQIADQINLPILIDDSFVNFDDQRIEYIKKLLEAISQHNQVLIFTAQENLVKKLQIKALTFEKGSNNA